MSVSTTARPACTWPTGLHRDVDGYCRRCGSPVDQPADDVADVPMGVAQVRAADVVVGDLVTELDSPEGPFYEVLAVEADGFTVDGQDYDGGCEGHEATTAGRYNGPIGETIDCDGSCLRPLPVPLEVGKRDAVLVRRPMVADPASDSAAFAVDPATVTLAPSGRFGFYRPQAQRWEDDGVVQIAQVIARGTGLEFHPTPGRYYDRTVLTMSPAVELSIDHGQGWTMPASDVVALKRFCFGGQRPLIEQGPLAPAAAPLTPRALADGLSALIAATAGELEAADVAALDAAFRVCERLA